MLAAIAPQARDGSAIAATPRGWPRCTHPVTGKPYTPSEIERLKYLRLKFPDNPLLPKTLSAGEVAELARQKATQQSLPAR